MSIIMFAICKLRIAQRFAATIWSDAHCANYYCNVPAATPQRTVPMEPQAARYNFSKCARRFSNKQRIA
jgi:hypothetical protein